MIRRCWLETISNGGSSGERPTEFHSSIQVQEYCLAAECPVVASKLVMQVRETFQYLSHDSEQFPSTLTEVG